MRYYDLRDIGILTSDKHEEFLFFLITNWYLLDILAYFHQFLSCGGTFQEFLNWAGTFRDIPISGNTYQEFLNWGWPISGFLDLWWHISGIPHLRLSLLKKFLENLIFLVCFHFCETFLTSNSHLFRWHWYSAKKLVQNAHFCLKSELIHFTTPYMESPPPAVFHDKAKRTQQGDLLQSQGLTKWNGGHLAIGSSRCLANPVFPDSLYLISQQPRICALSKTTLKNEYWCKWKNRYKFRTLSSPIAW